MWSIESIQNVNVVFCVWIVTAWKWQNFFVVFTYLNFWIQVRSRAAASFFYRCFCRHHFFWRRSFDWKNYRFCLLSRTAIDRKGQQVPLKLYITFLKIMLPQNKNLDFYSEVFSWQMSTWRRQYWKIIIPFVPCVWILTLRMYQNCYQNRHFSIFKVMVLHKCAPDFFHKCFILIVLNWLCRMRLKKTKFIPGVGILIAQNYDQKYLKKDISQYSYSYVSRTTSLISSINDSSDFVKFAEAYGLKKSDFFSGVDMMVIRKWFFFFDMSKFFNSNFRISKGFISFIRVSKDSFLLLAGYAVKMSWILFLRWIHNRQKMPRSFF